MFRNLAQLMNPTNIVPPPQQPFDVHPLQLSRWLDEAWATARTVPAFGTLLGPPLDWLGDSSIITTLDLPLPVPAATVAPPVPSGLNPATPDIFNGVPFITAPGAPGLVWDHLSYSYLIECTGVLEILAEVVRRYVVGETLSPFQPPAARWARSTEELFFREPPLFSVGGIISELRPDRRVARRNDYWRLLGMEPPHPIPARYARPGLPDQSWRLDTGGGVNTGFRTAWTELLRHVWLGIENANNGIGPNQTDREYIAYLVVALRDMLMMRRRGGQLAREEFVHVATLSWFHLSVERDTSPIVVQLNAQGANSADRLAAIAQRVGMTPAPRSRELFELADLMSGMLRAIEIGLFGDGASAETLYLDLGPTNAVLRRDMNRIIDLWQSTTGDRVKDRPGGSSAQPVRLPDPARQPGTVPVMSRREAPAAALASQNGRS
jgi:hypothetical protein